MLTVKGGGAGQTLTVSLTVKYQFFALQCKRKKSLHDGSHYKYSIGTKEQRQRLFEKFMFLKIYVWSAQIIFLLNLFLIWKMETSVCDFD